MGQGWKKCQEKQQKSDVEVTSWIIKVGVGLIRAGFAWPVKRAGNWGRSNLRSWGLSLQLCTQFSSPCYTAAGLTILQIFPHDLSSTSQSTACLFDKSCILQNSKGICNPSSLNPSHSFNWEEFWILPTTKKCSCSCMMNKRQKCCPEPCESYVWHLFPEQLESVERLTSYSCHVFFHRDVITWAALTWKTCSCPGRCRPERRD